MACQPTSYIRILLLVTLETESHIKMFPLNPVHSLHQPVAFLALYVFADMPLVIEQYMLRQKIGLYPRNWSAGVEIFMFFSNPRVFRNDVIMAIQAFLHRRQSRMNRSPHIGVAEFTLYILNTGMNPVTEGYGLLGTDSGRRRYVEKVQKS